MPIHNPPYYRYSFFEPWDKKTFLLIKRLARKRKYPTIVGSKKDKNRFLIMLIRTQKSLHGWRNFLMNILNQVKTNNSINTLILNQKHPPESVDTTKPAWVTYEEDEIVNDFIDELGRKDIDFVGTDEEIGEFVLRFILGQLGHDWEQTIMMIWETLEDDKEVFVNKLNKELKNFDYMRLFES